MFDSKDTFIDYHKFEDEVEHLDTKEEIEEIRQNRAQKIIKDFCVTNGITDAKQLIKNPEIMDSMINELMNKTNLSLRKIGEIVGLSKNSVHRVYRGIKSEYVGQKPPSPMSQR